MNLKQVFGSATLHLTSNDLVGLLLAAALFGPLAISVLGANAGAPLGIPGPLLFLVLAASVGVIYMAGVKVRDDLTTARLIWELLVFVPASFVVGWITYSRTDAYFTADNLYEVSAILLMFSIVSGLLERRAAKGTPSDILASATSRAALMGLTVFWILMSAGLQPVAALFMMLAGLLMLLTVLLRLPEAIVPIYHRRWRRRGRRP